LEKQKIVVIIGAGPAGLTAAHELLTRTNLRPIVLEAGDVVGGLARTVKLYGNRADLGGHRFFSKSGRVVSWWFSMLPLQRMEGLVPEPTMRAVLRAIPQAAAYANGPDPASTDEVMLVRTRLSHILFRRKFFDYPLSPTFATLRDLGPATLFRFAMSYGYARLFPLKEVNSLEDFFISRFGRELYRTFFKDYTEKVWGVPCSRIQPAWGAQRIKELSIGKALLDALRRLLPRGLGRQGEKTETSLISFFLYPKLGVGQMWDTAASRIGALGGEIRLNHCVVGIDRDGARVTGVRVKDAATGRTVTIHADYVFSTMPIRDLVLGMGESVPLPVREAAADLRYRDFLTLVLLFRSLKTRDGRLLDNWIYVQEADVQVGRIQVFNNWSPSLVSDPTCTLLGLEYFCQDTDALWSMSDRDLIALGIRELGELKLAGPDAFLDGNVIRSPKAYPAYFGGYERFPLIREYLDRIDNLFLIGRNGMHRYNNMDHSMLTAMTAVDNIINGVATRENIWQVNTEEEYHEEKNGS
jgi:protoporphyrinogen oxidase